MNNMSDYKPSLGGNGKSTPHFYDETERQVSWRDYVRILYRGRWIIIVSFALVMLATVFVTFTTEPVYQASAKLMIEKKSGMGESLFDFTSIMKKESMINNQVEILKSRSLAEDVIRRLQISTEANRLRILGNKPPDGNEKGNIFKSIRKYLKSKKNEEDLPPSFDDMVKSLRASIEVNPIRDTDMITISVTAPSPFEAEYLTNAVANSYKLYNRHQSQAEVRQVKNFLEKQLSQYQNDLSQSEEALKNYKEKAKVVALDKETEELVGKIAEVETLYNGAKTDMEAAQQRLAFIDKQLREQNINIDVESISSIPYLDELKKKIAEKEASLSMYLAEIIEKKAASYENTQREIDRQKSQIEALKGKFKEEVTKVAAAKFVDPAQMAGSLFNSKIEVETEIQALRPKVAAFQRIMEKYNAELDALPEKSLKLARLMRTAQVDEKIFIMLQEKYQESRITEVGQLGNVRIIDYGKAPKFPIKPKKKMNLLLGILIGLGLGVGIAFLMDYIDNSVRSVEDVESLGLPLVATIPFIKLEQTNGTIRKHITIDDPEVADINERLVTHLKPKSPVSEAYRTLRTNILFSAPDKPKKVVVVTSSGPKEGKSTSVSNLAITFAQMGTRTLLVDADLRRSVIHKLFGLDKRLGLTNILVGRSTLSEAVQRVEDLPHLDVLTSGIIPPNPAELLGSETMKRFIEEAREKYEIILLDAPPVIAVTDPSVLAPLVDGVVLVIRSAKAQRDAVMHAVEQLRRVKAPLMGALLNSIQASNVYGSYYYYYHYHYYYGADGEKKKQKSRRKRKKHASSY
ncbi:MAG: polysaccharide biosynthesis tyrosine autokinase [Actinobacteria bacterium]|nr:polysaccharide biosynthesis tyrosine autokinase [Actinomycetota bacterium]